MKVEGLIIPQELIRQQPPLELPQGIANCEFTFTATDGGMTVSETISIDARYFSTGIRYTDNSGSDSENCQTNLDFFQ